MDPQPIPLNDGDGRESDTWSESWDDRQTPARAARTRPQPPPQPPPRDRQEYDPDAQADPTDGDPRGPAVDLTAPARPPRTWRPPPPPSPDALRLLQQDPARMAAYASRKAAYDEAGRRADAQAEGQDLGTWDSLSHPDEWRVTRALGLGQSAEDERRRRGDELAGTLQSAEDAARSRRPLEPAQGPQKRSRPARPTAPQRDALEHSAADYRRDERRRGEWPAPLSNEDADRRSHDLPIDGEPRQPGPHLLTPDSARSLPDLWTGLGNELGRRITRDADRHGGGNHPAVPWPDARPPRPHQAEPTPPETARPAEPRARREDRDLGRLVGTLDRLATRLQEGQDRSEAPAIACPPPFRGGGVRM